MLHRTVGARCGSTTTTHVPTHTRTHTVKPFRDVVRGTGQEDERGALEGGSRTPDGRGVATERGHSKLTGETEVHFQLGQLCERWHGLVWHVQFACVLEANGCVASIDTIWTACCFHGTVSGGAVGPRAM